MRIWSGLHHWRERERERERETETETERQRETERARNVDWELSYLEVAGGSKAFATDIAGVRFDAGV